MENDLISIIIPVYKVEKYLEKCIESVLKQTYTNLQIILVDDGSPDNCGKICDEYAKKDPRIEVIHKVNGGLSDARNVGIAKAKGKYIGFVDSDDYIKEDMYEILINLIKEYDADVSICNLYDVIDGKENATEEIISKEDVQKIKDKYMNIITNAVSNGTFSSNKDAKITYNNNTVSAKAYTVSLTSEQVEGMIVEILNNLKEEDKIGEKYQDKINDIISNITDEKEIPAVKITVYEQNKKTIRTAIEITSLAKITVENTDENNELKTKIQISGISTETTEEYNIEITKKTDENQENVEAVLSVTNGDDTYQAGISNTLKNSDSEIQIKTIFEYKKDILTAALNLNNNIILGDSFEKKQTLANNNYVLNDAPAESRQKVITQLKQVVPEKMTTRMGLLMEAIGLKQNNVTETEKPESEMTQVDINKFNAKFEFFTGDEVTPENVKTLIGIAKENLGSYEINIVEDSQNSGNTTTTDPEKIKYSIKLKIEKGKTNEDGTNQILAKISDKKKYKVSIFYKEQNNMIDYITIDEAAK